MCTCYLLSQIPLRYQNTDYTTGQISDLSDKLEHAETQLGRGTVVYTMDPHEKRTEDKLSKATKDSCKTTIEGIHGLMAQIIKDTLFNKTTAAITEN